MASFGLVGLGGGGDAATHKGLVGHGGGGDAATHKPVAGAHALHAAVADATRVSELAAGRIQAGFRGHVVRAELDSIRRRNMKAHGLRRLHIRRYTLCKPWRHAISVMLALDVWLKDDENVKVREKNDKRHVEDATKKNKVVFEVKNYEELRKVEMSKQGDESMYTMDALSKRRHCRIHPKVVNAINSWWDHFSENNEEGKEVVKCEAYAIMNMALDLVINHDAGLDDSKWWKLRERISWMTPTDSSIWTALSFSKQFSSLPISGRQPLTQTTMRNFLANFSGKSRMRSAGTGSA